jgi:hypothetical protein
MPNKKQLRETDLYPPLVGYLTSLGYTVRGEVNGCDIAATRGDDLVVIEMKCAFNTQLLIQATKRQRLTDSVYIALPKPKQTPHWRGIRHLLRRLELGLIFVCFHGRRKPTVEAIFHPLPYQRQKRKRLTRAVLAEMSARSGDFNQGGATRTKIITAYRENALQIASHLDTLGPLSPKQLRALGTGPKTHSILYSNFYGWFERVDRGIYALREKGREEIKHYPGVV